MSGVRYMLMLFLGILIFAPCVFLANLWKGVREAASIVRDAVRGEM